MAVHEIARRLIGGVWRTVDAEEDGAGNGGSLPDWWTVVSTPGSEKATFAGALELHQTNESIRAFKIEGVPGVAADGYEIWEVLDEPGGNRLWGFDSWGQFACDMFEHAPFVATSEYIAHRASDGNGVTIARLSTGVEGVAPILPSDRGGAQLIASQVAMPVRITADDGEIVRVEHDSKLGFFGATPATKPTGVAVNAAGIHAALVTLGLIAA